MFMKSFAPIRAEHSWHHYRTPVWVNIDADNDRFEVWIGDNMVRHFKTDELPDEIKLKLAMVMAADKLGTRRLREDAEVLSNPNVFFMFSLPLELHYLLDVGWRISPNCICIILSKELLFSLRGEYDTGRESKNSS
jgi:hypothetical protein